MFLLISCNREVIIVGTSRNGTGFPSNHLDDMSYPRFSHLIKWMYLWFLESHVYLTIASEPLSSLLRVFLGCVCQLEVLVQEWDCVENKSQKDQKAEKSWDTYTKVIVIFLWQGVVCWSHCYPNIRKGHSTLIIWEHKVNSKRASLISFTKESPVNRVKLQKWRKSIPIYW